jgi:hypothetical protein
MPGSFTSSVKVCWPVVFAGLSRRRRSALPISVQAPASFNVTSAGGVSFAAASASSPKVAFLPLAWLTTPLETVISPAGTFHCLAAAETSITRAVAPARR